MINNQNADGGFSLKIKQDSDPLSTSLALLCLKLYYDNKHSAIKKTINYLYTTQNQDGSWLEVDFIKPKVHEPYKSKTLTTAFVLKALSA